MARDEELAKPESAEAAAAAEAAPRIVGPVFPGTPSEFITVLAHYHRAEIARMAGWRDRIDRTSNWAITVVGAMLSATVLAVVAGSVLGSWVQSRHLTRVAALGFIAIGAWMLARG